MVHRRYEIMVLFVLHKLILQTRMFSHPILNYGPQLKLHIPSTLREENKEYALS